MKELVLIYDESTIDPIELQKANELLNTSSDIDYIQKNLPQGINIAWVDKDKGVLELI